MNTCSRDKGLEIAAYVATATAAVMLLTSF